MNSSTSIKALLVEDNPGDVRLIEEMLSNETTVPIYLKHVDRLSKALSYLANEKVDVALLDLSLPDSQGIDTLARMCAEAPMLPIVILTGLDDQSLAIKAVREGAQDYLIKGQVGVNLLVRTLRYAIERRRISEELKASKNSFQNIVNKSGDGILIVDKNGIVCFINPALEFMFGRAAGDFIGKPADLPLCPGKSTEVDIARYGGGLGIGEIRVVDSEWEGKSAYLLTLRDITERKWAEDRALESLEKLTATQESLVQAEKLSSIGQLVAGVAHELNNPLTSIRLLSEVVIQRDLNDTIRKEIEMICDEAERSLRIVGNLLSFARREEPQKIYVSANVPIEAALELRRYEMMVSNIELETQLQPDLPLTMADPHELQQVALNLIVNAEQAMLEAHGKGKLLVKTHQVGSTIHIIVSDDGPGFSKENMGKLFDPFFTTKDIGKGTGLGLSLCYGIIKNHGGEITVESDASEGAVFTVKLPVLSEPTTLEANAGTGRDELIETHALSEVL